MLDPISTSKKSQISSEENRVLDIRSELSSLKQTIEKLEKIFEYSRKES